MGGFVQKSAATSTKLGDRLLLAPSLTASKAGRWCPLPFDPVCLCGCVICNAKGNKQQLNSVRDT